MYSAQLLEHFQNPRNTGDLANSDSIVQVENPACGDVLRLSLKIEGDRIVDARFKAKGCVPSIACGSVVTEILLGRTIESARELSRSDIIAVLGSLPQASTHAAQLAIDTLSAALRQLKG